MSTAPEFPVTATGYQSVLSAVIERTVGPQLAEIDRTGAFPRDDFVGRVCLGCRCSTHRVSERGG